MTTIGLLVATVIVLGATTLRYAPLPERWRPLMLSVWGWTSWALWLWAAVPVLRSEPSWAGGIVVAAAVALYPLTMWAARRPGQRFTDSL